MTDVLSQRGLGRATLARQYLLERAPARAIDAIGYTRLSRSLANEAGLFFFRTYRARYARFDGATFPALVPQVYLHYDPYVRSQLGVQPGQLKRQRMDFLLLLPRRAGSGLGDASSARLHRGPPLRAALRRARPPCLRGGR